MTMTKVASESEHIEEGKEANALHNHLAASKVYTFSASSPTGIPAWIWLPLLTCFLGATVYLSLRGILHVLPAPIARPLQAIVDRASDALHSKYRQWRTGGNIRLHDGPRGRDQLVAMSLDLDESDDGHDDDDELPLANMAGPQGMLGRAKREIKLNRIVSLLSGKGSAVRHAGYENGYLGNGDLENDGRGQEERILDLPRLKTTNVVSGGYRPRSGSSASSTHSSMNGSPKVASGGGTLFRADASESDAPSLPHHFASHHFSNAQPLSPASPRSMKSPSLSRRPSLLAIQEQEESSVSPRSSTDSKGRQENRGIGIEMEGPQSAVMSTSSSSSSETDGIPDWQSARSAGTVRAM